MYDYKQNKSVLKVIPKVLLSTDVYFTCQTSEMFKHSNSFIFILQPKKIKFRFDS